MRFLEFPTYGSKSDHERVRSYIPRDDPGDEADAIAVNKPWPDRERPCDLLFIDIEDKTGCTVTQGTAFSLTLSAQTERVTVRQIEPKSVDYTEVRLWIDHCDSTHGLSCHTATKLDVPGFKVIDCFNRKVVPLPDLQTQYVALSYVWGNPNRKVDSSERFPQTIEDSIAVTSRLGYRYLWVDRYCIDQGDEDNKHIQVSMMDLIYSQACLTIVAAEGDAYDGLPGVNGLSRSVQKHLTIGQMRMNEWFKPHERILTSNWNTRAWTYQEGALSRRRLFFTDVGVAFWCQQMYCQESVKERPLPSDLQYERSASAQLEKIIPRVADVWKQTNFAQAINQYSRKTMSSDSDALNACLGVLRALDTSFLPGHGRDGEVKSTTMITANTPFAVQNLELTPL
ncbi:heterokaryon incompatibility protein-domain-containing protein [Alternaria alternata]|nr:heterokaryon incompatibility protein-domain-containing protein [Alternaria alternata]